MTIEADETPGRASSFEEMMWASTRDILSTVPVGVEDGFYRAAILHWFNERTLKATNRSGHLTTIGRRRDRPEDPAKLYAALCELPFVEEYQDRGHDIHNATRDSALRHLWASERRFYRSISAQAARFFGRQMRTQRGSYAEDLIEWFYHRLVVNEPEAVAVGDSLIDTFLGRGDAAYAYAMAAAVDEQTNLGHVEPETAALGQLWRAQIALSTEHQRDAVALALEIADRQGDGSIPDVRRRAYEISARASSALGSYADAANWYGRAIQLAEPSTDAATMDLVGLANVLREQNFFESSEDAYRQALDGYVPRLLMPLRRDQIDADGSDIGDLLQVADPDAAPGTEVSYVPKSVLGSNPNAWLHIDNYPSVAIGVPDENQSSRVDAYWPVTPTAILAEAMRSLASLYVDTHRLAEAKRAAKLAVDIARDLGDSFAASAAMEVLFDASASVFDSDILDSAIVEHLDALDLAQTLGDRAGEMRAHLWLAKAYVVVSDLQTAQAQYEFASTLAVDTGNSQGQAQCLEGLGSIAWSVGDFADAAEKFALALDLYQRGAYRREEGQILRRMGELSLDRHDPKRATAWYEQALAVFTDLKLPLAQVDALLGLARVAQDRHEIKYAVKQLREALSIVRGVGVKSAEATVLSMLGGVLASAGRYKAAADTFETALDVARTAGSKDQEAEIVAQRGWAKLLQHKWTEAERDYKRARDLYRKINRADGQLTALTGLLAVYEEKGDYRRGIEIGEEALALARSMNTFAWESSVIQNLAPAYSESGETRGIELLEYVLKKDPTDAVSTLNLGWNLYLAGDYKRSISTSSQALELDAKQTYALRNLGHATLALGQPAQAIFWYDRAIGERHEGEDFVITIKVLKTLARDQPDLPRVHEVLAAFIDVQAGIERGEDPRSLPIDIKRRRPDGVPSPS